MRVGLVSVILCRLISSQARRDKMWFPPRIISREDVARGIIPHTPFSHAGEMAAEDRWSGIASESEPSGRLLKVAKRRQASPNVLSPSSEVLALHTPDIQPSIGMPYP